MSILYGFYTADSGGIFVNGQLENITDSRHALALGIGMVHQHFMLVDNFSILENVILGVEDYLPLLAPPRCAARRASKELRRLADEYSLDVDPDAIVQDVSVGQQQRVEILKALYRGADTLILDEPTGVLTPEEADDLFRVLKTLREQGKTVILITHKLREIMAITDTVSVMRQGQMVATVPTAETSPGALAELMVGRRVLLRVEKGPAHPGKELLEVDNLVVADDLKVTRVKGVSFSVRAGEIVGIAGVAGNGQSELLEAVSGMKARGPSKWHRQGFRQQALRFRFTATMAQPACARQNWRMCRKTVSVWASSCSSRSGRTPSWATRTTPSLWQRRHPPRCRRGA